jgi:hypothetical protein
MQVFRRARNTQHISFCQYTYNDLAHEYDYPLWDACKVDMNITKK